MTSFKGENASAQSLTSRSECTQVELLELSRQNGEESRNEAHALSSFRETASSIDVSAILVLSPFSGGHCSVVGC